MCLLVEQPEDVVFTDAFLTDVYSKNRDGLGIMYAENGKVVVKKSIPATAAEFIADAASGTLVCRPTATST
jgi:hypothetical protein